MPRPASRCCRALRQTAASPIDHVWISDSFLSAAFERYCAISRQTKRSLGNVPGPLEGQRRLGKRRMGDLNAFQPAPLFPNWGFPDAVDLSKWRWQPPTSPSVREKGRNWPGNRKTSFLGWLQSLQEWTPAPKVDVPIAPPEPTPEIQAFDRSLSAFLTIIATAPVDTITADFEHLCSQFSQHICLGEITGERLAYVSTRLWEAVDSRLANSSLARILCLSLYTAVVSAISQSNVLTSGMVDAAFWDTMLVRMSWLPINDELCDVFESLMTSLPKEHFAELKTGTLAMLNAFFSNWGATGHCLDASAVSSLSENADLALTRLTDLVVTIGNCSLSDAHQARAHLQEAQELLQKAQNAISALESAISPHSRHLQSICNALEALGHEHVKELQGPAYEGLLQQDPVSPEARRQMAFNWLEILARSVSISRGTFFWHAGILFDGQPHTDSLSDAEICDLILQRWQSRKNVIRPGRIRWFHKVSARKDKRTRLAWLPVFLLRTQRMFSDSKTDKFNLFVRDYCQFLSRLKRVGDLTNSVESMLRQGRNVHAKHILPKLAKHVDDARVALRLHDLYVREIQKPGEEWDPDVMGKYAARLVIDPFLVDKVWSALNIKLDKHKLYICSQRREERKPRELDEFTAKKVAIVERIAPVLEGVQEQLGNRVAFRHISQMVRYLEMHKGPDGLPLEVAGALARIVTKDLQNERPGRTSRLRWLLAVIERNFGPEATIKSGLEIQRWRAMVKQKWLQTIQEEQWARLRQRQMKRPGSIIHKISVPAGQDEKNCGASG